MPVKHVEVRDGIGGRVQEQRRLGGGGVQEVRGGGRVGQRRVSQARRGRATTTVHGADGSVGGGFYVFP